jgi:endonuclease G, mitochondrial
MTTANLSRTASLGAMRRLSSVARLDALERPGAEPTSQPDVFQGRTGFDAAFLNGWNIDLPRATGASAADMRTLRRAGSDVELKYRNFSVVMSASRRMPMLTGVNIDGLESRRLGRIDTWSYDGRLDKEDQWGDALYANNQLDRGHMVRREDPVWGTLDAATEANQDTFHFTNCCPQMAGVNQQTWLGLENYILEHARADGMRVNVFTAPYFSEQDLEYRGAKIPLAFWKVVAIVTEDGRPSATAYEVTQTKELHELGFTFAGYKTYQISVQKVIDLAHIDFSPLIPYDGFSQHERTTGERLTEALETLAAIRI